MLACYALACYTFTQGTTKPANQREAINMTTLIKPRYEGRTYLATLATGRKIAITVQQGYIPAGGGGEIARLQDVSMARHGLAVAGYKIVDLAPSPPITPKVRYWAVELRREFYHWGYIDGTPDCYADYEHDYVIAEARCFAEVYESEAVKKAMADGWEVSGIRLSVAPVPVMACNEEF